MFLKNITEVKHPLYNLLKKKKMFEWGRNMNKFSKSEKIIGTELKLFLPDFNIIFVL